MTAIDALSIVQYAWLDPELFAILQDPGQRVILLRVLIDSWYAGRSPLLG